MQREFHQTVWDAQLERGWQALLQSGHRRGFGDSGDWTTQALCDDNAVARRRRCPAIGHSGGLPASSHAGGRGTAAPLAAANGRRPTGGQRRVRGHDPGAGPRECFAAERILLNFLGRLSGIATLTRQYVDAVAGTTARIYDTRKTTPGWRRLEKYAVRCGGGWNHRGGLFEAVLIKDNHLAWAPRPPLAL